MKLIRGWQDINIKTYQDMFDKMKPESKAVYALLDEAGLSSVFEADVDLSAIFYSTSAEYLKSLNYIRLSALVNQMKRIIRTADISYPCSNSVFIGWQRFKIQTDLKAISQRDYLRLMEYHKDSETLSMNLHNSFSIVFTPVNFLGKSKNMNQKEVAKYIQENMDMRKAFSFSQYILNHNPESINSNIRTYDN